MEQLISKLTDSFASSLSENDAELIDAFRKHLYTLRDKILNDDFKFINKDEESIKNAIRIIADDYISADIDEKRKYLLRDEAYEQIIAISGRACQNAKKIIQKEKIDEDFDAELQKEKLKKLLDSVKEYNKEEATKFVSEGLLDLEFIQNPKTKCLSLRLGRVVREAKRKQREIER